MARWIVGCTVSLLLLCISAGAISYFVAVPRVQHHLGDSLTTAMSRELTTSVFEGIETNGITNGRVVIHPSDLDVNTEDRPGEAGFEVTDDGSIVYGGEMAIDESGITLSFMNATYSGSPVIEDGGLVLTAVQSTSGAFDLFYDDDAFEATVEQGINDALAARNLIPVAVTLAPGAMWIEVRTNDGGFVADVPPASPTSVTTARWVD
jgi:hypothetical protein